MAWVMTMVYWENILLFIITGHEFQPAMMDIWIVHQKAAAQQVPICPALEMYTNRKRIFLRGYATTFGAFRTF